MKPFTPPSRRPVPSPPRADRKDTRPHLGSILYVEDEQMNWEIAVSKLSGRYTLTRAASSREAFAKLRKERFDLILMDIQLSGSDLDGVAMTKILRNKYDGTVPDYARGLGPIETPIVFVTAYAARYKLEDLVAAGGDEMITKPVDFVQLSLAVARLLAKRIIGDGDRNASAGS